MAPSATKGEKMGGGPEHGVGESPSVKREGNLHDGTCVFLLITVSKTRPTESTAKYVRRHNVRIYLEYILVLHT